MSEPMLRMEVQDRTAVLTLDRPEARNALSIALQDALIAGLREVDARDDIGVVILTGAGPSSRR